MTRPDPDILARRTLRQHRLFATGLLVLMAGLTLASYFVPPSWWAGLLQAAAKAGFIGGIADWFAVTALFRHPLGIPIPHTAIIPNQRQRLGQALGRFVATHVFTSTEVSSVLGRLDLPGIVHRFLADPGGRPSGGGRPVQHAAQTARLGGGRQGATGFGADRAPDRRRTGGWQSCRPCAA